MTVVYLFQLMRVQNHNRQLLIVALRAIQFLLAVFIEQAAIVETRERVGGSVDLQLLEFVVLHEDWNAQKIRRCEYIDHCGFERDCSTETIAQFATPLK